MNPTNYSVGQRVYISLENWKNVRNSNRSIHVYPDDRFVNIVYGLMKNNTAATITKRFTPGYEFNATFDNGQILQMKDSWVTPLPDYAPVELINDLF